MTQTKYYSNLKKIAYPEITGIIICLIGASFIALNFYKLNTTFLQGAGIVAILLLLILSIISLLSLRPFRPGDVNKPYAETLRKFTIQKIQFLKLQKINIILSYLLLVTIIISLSKFFGGKDIAYNKYFWILSFSFGYIFLLFYSKWVLRHYSKTLRQLEEVLKELQS